MIENCHSEILSITKVKLVKGFCCNDLCQIVVLKALVDGALERDSTEATHMSVWS